MEEKEDIRAGVVLPADVAESLQEIWKAKTGSYHGAWQGMLTLGADLVLKEEQQRDAHRDAPKVNSLTTGENTCATIELNVKVHLSEIENRFLLAAIGLLATLISRREEIPEEMSIVVSSLAVGDRALAPHSDEDRTDFRTALNAFRNARVTGKRSPQGRK